MSFETLFNPGARPAFLDAAGRRVDPHSFVAADVADEFVAAQVASGALVVIETPEALPAEVSDEAAVAMNATLASRQAYLEHQMAEAERLAKKTEAQKNAAKKPAGGSKTQDDDPALTGSRSTDQTDQTNSTEAI